MCGYIKWNMYMYSLKMEDICHRNHCIYRLVRYACGRIWVPFI